MPEISFFIFDLEHLFKLLPKSDGASSQNISEYEYKAQENMIQIRMNLFSEFGYKADFDKALT